MGDWRWGGGACGHERVQAVGRLGLPRRANEGCLFCHVGSMDVPSTDWDWASDDNPMKVKARAMMGMVREINGRWLAGLDRTSKRDVACYTCHAVVVHRLNIEASDDPAAHHGLIRLRLLEALEEGGIDAMVARYEASWAEHPAEAYTPPLLSGLGWTLVRSGREAAGFRLFELNYEGHPETYSTTEDLAWGNEAMGNHDRALELARASVERHPGHALGERLLAELRSRG